MEQIIALFNNVAVPVACLIVTFWLWDRERTDHKEEMKQITGALNNNTLVMQQLVDKLKVD